MSKFTDEFTQFNAGYLIIKTINMAIDKLTRYLEDLVIPRGFRLQLLRADWGGEYKVDYYQKYCRSMGIKQ